MMCNCNPRVWAKNVHIKISSTHSLAAYVFAFVQHRFLKKIHKQTKLPNLWPKPLKLVIPAFCHFFALFSNGTTGPKQNTKSTKSKLQPLQWENWQIVRSRSLALQKTKRNTRNQKNKKPKKNKKKYMIAHPKRVMAESWVLSFCFLLFLFILFIYCFLFFWILVLSSHCRKPKQKLPMVAKQWENHGTGTCAVSVVAECSHSQGVPFWNS